jgi:hypothetical protein
VRTGSRRIEPTEPFDQEDYMNRNSNNSNAQEMDVDVLYQRLGDRWFAFSIIGDEVFMAPISEDQIDSIRKEEMNSPRNFDHHEAA